MCGFRSAVVEGRQAYLNAVNLRQLWLQPLRAHTNLLSARPHARLRTMPEGVVLDSAG